MKTDSQPPTLLQHPVVIKLKPHLPLIALLFSLLIIFLVRFFTAMTHLDMGQDIANYLTTMNTVFGEDATGVGLLRPPLIAIPLKLFTLIFGNLTGVKLFGVAVSVAIGLPFYALAKRISPSWIAAAIAVVFVLTSPYSRMLAWGYITMTGIFFILLTLHFLILTIERPSVINAVITGLAISMVAGLHQLSFTFLVLMLLVVMLALLLFNRSALLAARKHLAVAAVAAILLTAPYIPIYLHLINLQQGGGEGTSASVEPLANLASYLIQPHYSIGILLGIALVVLTLFALWKYDRNRSLLLGALFFLFLGLSLFALPGPIVELNRRAPLFLYISIWLLLAVALSFLWQWKVQYSGNALRYLPRVVVGLTLVALIVSCSLTSHHELCSGLNFYGYLNDHRWEAVRWVKNNTSSTAIVAAYPESLGWWIEGEAGRTAFQTTDRGMVPYGFEAEQSLQTERILSRNQGLENGCLRLAYCHPFTSVPGNPVLGACVGGQYQDFIMFDDAATYTTFADSSSETLAYASKDFSISGNSEAMEATASYDMGGAVVTQMAQLQRDASHTFLTYSVDSQSQSITRLEIPLFFCTADTTLIVHQTDSHVEIFQRTTTAFKGEVEVKTDLYFEVTGATLLTLAPAGDHLNISFIVQNDKAAITLNLATTLPDQPAGSDVVHYQVQRVLEEYEIDLVAVDFRPGSTLWADLCPSTKLWLDACPYYDLVYSEQSVKIYRVRLPS